MKKKFFVTRYAKPGGNDGLILVTHVIEADLMLSAGGLVRFVGRLPGALRSTTILAVPTHLLIELREEE